MSSGAAASSDVAGPALPEGRPRLRRGAVALLRAGLSSGGTGNGIVNGRGRVTVLGTAPPASRSTSLWVALPTRDSGKEQADRPRKEQEDTDPGEPIAKFCVQGRDRAARQVGGDRHEGCAIGPCLGQDAPVRVAHGQ